MRRTIVGFIAACTLGLALGYAVPTLMAQAKPVYVCTWIEPKGSIDTYLKDFAPKAQALIKSNGGATLAASQKITSLDGAPAPPRMTVQKWPSMDALTSYRNSAAFKALNRDQYATFKAFAVEGDQ
jgi:uncharacterized protein (DUF1330 family)